MIKLFLGSIEENFVQGEIRVFFRCFNEMFSNETPVEFWSLESLVVNVLKRDFANKQYFSV